jgi:hypothetical protein
MNNINEFKNRRILIFLCSILLISLSVTYQINSTLPEVGKDRVSCSDNVIKEHILSLTDSYSDSQIDNMIPSIKSKLIKEGRC